MLEDYFPLLVYAILAAAIPATMIAFSFIFATRPKSRVNARFLPSETRVSGRSTISMGRDGSSAESRHRNGTL